MILPTGEKEPFILNEYSVYPNPTTELVNFSTKNKTAKSVEIFDYSGKLIEQSELINGMTTFISSKYSEGVYLYRIIDNNGKVLKTDKITVMK
jgi:hypothetical protein